MPKQLIASLRLNRSGLERLFGGLEARIMESVWELGEPTVQKVIDHLGGEMNYKTVMTVMNRLATKGALQRRKEGRAFRYPAALDRTAFLSRATRQVYAALLEDFGPSAVAQFVEAAREVDPALLEELRRAVRDFREG